MQTVDVIIPVGNDSIHGDLTLIPNANSLVIFAHGSGSSRFSARNKFIASILHKHHIATLLFDLLTEFEDERDQQTREFRFNIPLLGERLKLVTHWALNYQDTVHMRLGYFGASTGAAAALIAAAQLPEDIRAVVSRGGRPDLADAYLGKVKAATLLIMGSLDYEVIRLNEEAFNKLECTKEMYFVENATHLFEEPGTLEEAANVAADWFIKFLRDADEL